MPAQLTSARGLRAQVCAEDLEHAGHPSTLPTGGAVFVSPEVYAATVAAVDPLKDRKILVPGFSSVNEQPKKQNYYCKHSAL